MINLIYLFGDHVHSDYLVVLGQESGNGEADVAGADYCNNHVLHIQFST